MVILDGSNSGVPGFLLGLFSGFFLYIVGAERGKNTRILAKTPREPA